MRRTTTEESRLNEIREITTTPLNTSSVRMDDISEALFLGPQSDVLRCLEDINSRWNTDIGLNKAFGMKPGGYDQIKDLLTDQAFKFNMKNSGIEKVFSRIQNYNYIFTHIQRQFSALQTKVREAKESNIQWSDNSEEAVNSFNTMKEKLNLETYANAFEDIIVSDITLNTVRYAENVEAYRDYFIQIDLVINKDHMRITNENMVTIQEIEMSPINVRIRLNFLKLLNTYALGRNRRCVTEGNGAIRIPRTHSPGYHDPEIAGFDFTYDNPIRIRSKYDADKRLKHPFLSSERDYSYDQDGQPRFLGQCFGDLNSEILGDIWSMNMPMLLLNLGNWSSNFTINKTHPLNSPITLFFGWPEYLTKKYTSIIGKRESSDCKIATSNMSESDFSICNTIKCVLRDDCRWYLVQTTGNPLTPIKEALLGEIIEIADFNESCSEYYSIISRDYTEEQYANQLANLISVKKDPLFTAMIEELSDQKAESSSLTWMYFGLTKDWDELRYECEHEGVDVYNLELLHTDWHSRSTQSTDIDPGEQEVRRRISALGNAIPINISNRLTNDALNRSVTQMEEAIREREEEMIMHEEITNQSTGNIHAGEYDEEITNREELTDIPF